MDDYSSGGPAGNLIFAIPLLIVVIWVIVKSPLIAALVKMGLLVTWGLGSLGVVLFVVLGMHVPNGHYGAAIVTILVGAVLYVPFFMFGVPMMKSVASSLAKGPVMWE